VSHLSVNILRFAERALLQGPQSGLQIALADHPEQSSSKDCQQWVQDCCPSPCGIAHKLLNNLGVMAFRHAHLHSL